MTADRWTHHDPAVRELIRAAQAAADPQAILALLDRLEAAEAKVARVTDLLDTWERSHSHLGVDRHHWGPSSRSLRAALAPAPTEAANGRQIGSDERVGTKEDA